MKRFSAPAIILAFLLTSAAQASIVISVAQNYIDACPCDT
jgi:hypothetical protein